MKPGPQVPLTVLAATAALVLGGATTSAASWDARSAVGSATSALAASVPSVGPVVARRNDTSLGFTVTVTWNPVTVEGVAVRGYEVVRYVTPVLGTPTRTSGSGTCDAVLVTTSCVDTGSLLGLGGSLTYVVTPLVATNWRGPSTTSNTT